MSHGIFVTGTSTGVGKTAVASALLRLAGSRGHRAAGFKPVASGSRLDEAGRLRNEDARQLQAAASVALPYEEVNPFCFAPAIAPHIAAREAGVDIGVPRLVDAYQLVASRADLVVVEGAGGWRVPLHPAGFMSDLPEALRVDVLLVVGLTLGCLNHARLTYEAIRADGRCRWLGWIANTVDPAFCRVDENVASLTELLNSEPLAQIPWQGVRSQAGPAPLVLDLAGAPRVAATLDLLRPATSGLR